MRPGRPCRLAIASAAALIATLAPAAAGAQTVSATLDRNEIGVHETVQLEIVVEGSWGAELGRPEQFDFGIVSQMTSTSRNIGRDGRAISRTSITLILRPLRTGALTIGSFSVRTREGIARTEPFEIVVTDEPPARAQRPPPRSGPSTPVRRGAGEHTFDPSASAPPPTSDGLYTLAPAEIPRGEPFFVVDVTDATPVRGQQIIVDYILYTPRNALRVEAVELTEPEFAGFWFQDITDVRTARSSARLRGSRVGGEAYDAQLLRSYALVPLRTGEATVPPIRIELLLRGFVRGLGRRVVSSIPMAIQVSDPPRNERPAAFRIGNVGALELSAAVTRSTARVGDTIQLEVFVRGVGLISNLSLPELPDLDGARTFDGNESTAMDVGSDAWLRGSTYRRISVVPERPGRLLIPPLELVFYDPWQSTYRTATTQPIEIMVSGVNPQTASPVDTAETIGSGDWTSDLPAERLVDDRGRRAGRWHTTPSYFAALALPIIAYLGLALGARIADKRRATAATRAARVAARSAARALRRGGADAESVAAVLRRYLSDVTGRPTRGWTSQRLRAEVARLADSESAAIFAEVLERAERARYGGGGDLESLVADAHEAIRAIEARR